MSELPAGWEETGLLELSSLVQGVTYGRSDAIDFAKDGYLPVLRATNITDHGFIFDDLVYVPSTLISDDQRLRIGDVVIATSSGSASVVGKACQVKERIDAAFGAFCGVLRPK
jgi:type I restriction enzyme S subunit